MVEALSYDTLPANSTLRREVENGVLKITAAAEEPGPAARRGAQILAAIPAAFLSLAVLVAFLMALAPTYVANRRNIGWALSIILVIAFVVFCAALFLFVWKAQFAARMEALERALRQTTILAASPGKLLIETAGPFGQASYEFAAPLFRVAKSRDMSCLEIDDPSGDPLQVLRGRSAAELVWVMRGLRAAIEP